MLLVYSLEEAPGVLRDGQQEVGEGYHGAFLNLAAPHKRLASATCLVHHHHLAPTHQLRQVGSLPSRACNICMDLRAGTETSFWMSAKVGTSHYKMFMLEHALR